MNIQYSFLISCIITNMCIFLNLYYRYNMKCFDNSFLGSINCHNTIKKNKGTFLASREAGLEVTVTRMQGKIIKI